ncbi:MAG: exosortase H-associated membrane protein [Halioglobus sp.]
MVEKHQLRQFLLFVFTLLIPCFALWTVASGPLAMPAIGFVNTVLTHWYPDLVHALYVDGNHALLMTEFGEQNGQIVPLAGAEYRFGVQVNPRILTYSLPFYTALHFATQKKEYLNSYVLGLLALYPLLTFGLLCLCLKELMVSLGTRFWTSQGFTSPMPT